MGDDIDSGSVTGCSLWSLGDHRRQSDTEPEPMSSPIDYPALSYAHRPSKSGHRPDGHCLNHLKIKHKQTGDYKS